MTILNETDAQKADTPVAVGLRVRVENPDGTIAGRISLGALLPHGDNTTLTESADGILSVVGQTPAPESSTVTLANLNILLADGTYLTGPLLQTLLGISPQSSTTPTPTPTPSPSPSPTPTPTATAQQSAYTVSLITQGDASGGAFAGHNSPSISVVKSSDGTTPASVSIGYSTSNTTFSPPNSYGAFTSTGTYTAGGGSAQFVTQPSFTATGTFYWWVQTPDNVSIPIAGANPIVIS